MFINVQIYNKSNLKRFIESKILLKQRKISMKRQYLLYSWPFNDGEFL